MYTRRCSGGEILISFGMAVRAHHFRTNWDHKNEIFNDLLMKKANEDYSIED